MSMNDLKRPDAKQIPAQKVPAAWVPCLVSLIGAVGSRLAWELWFTAGGWFRHEHSAEAMLWLVSIVIGLWGSIDSIRFARGRYKLDAPVSFGGALDMWAAFGGALLGVFHILSLLLYSLFLQLLLSNQMPR